jgi:Ran-interacting Mog1 protein
LGPKKEVFVDPSRDESLIFELLDLKNEVADQESSTWFLHDLAVEQDATDNMVSFMFLMSATKTVFVWHVVIFALVQVLEHSGTIELTGLQCGNAPLPAMTAVGQMVPLCHSFSLTVLLWY